MLSENKFSRYFLYAIGEILLVVIGILIALQINNNNEASKAKIFEHKMLNEIRKDLILDTIYFNAIKSRPIRTEKAADRLIKMKKDGLVIKDSVPFLFDQLGTNFNFSYHNGAYESLKSVGLDKISNDALRNWIAEMYDFNYPRTQELIDPIKKETIDYYRKTFDKFFVIDFKASYVGKPIPSLTIEAEHVLNEPHFLNTIYYRMSYAKNSIHRIKGITKSASLLLKSIDSELNIDDPEKNRPKRDWQ